MLGAVMLLISGLWSEGGDFKVPCLKIWYKIQVYAPNQKERILESQFEHLTYFIIAFWQSKKKEITNPGFFVVLED